MSTPPLSRTNSRTDLEESSGSGSKELEKDSRKKSVNPPADSGSSSKVPSTSNRTLKRTGTWSTGYMPKDKGEDSSNPMLSPRTTKASKPTKSLPPSSANAVTSSSNSSTPSTSAPQTKLGVPLPGGSAIPIYDNRVFASDLSTRVISYVNVALQSDANLAPDRLGELLVAVESKGGQNKLAGDAINRILRGALMIRGFEPASGGAQSDLNVVVRICEPFMHRQLDTPEFDKARKKFINDFGKVAEKFESLSKVIPQKEWTTSPEMKKLMSPVMKPVMELICGKANNLDSSALPDAIKKALLSIDKYVIAWFEKNGTGKPADLLGARKNALIGFLATRSLSYVWLTKAKEEKSIDEAHLTRLISYMNSYVSHDVNDFVTDVLLKQTEQPTEARKYIEVMTNRSTLKSKSSVPKLALGFGTPLAGEKVLSARGRASISTAHSAEGEAPTDKAAEKKAKVALMKMRVERAILVDKIAKESGVDKVDHKFYQYVKEIVVKMSKRGFDHFKNDPVKSFTKYADKYYAKIENHKQVKEGLPAKVSNALDAYNLKLIGNPFETEEDSVETEPSDETEIETESSEDDKQS